MEWCTARPLHHFCIMDQKRYKGSIVPSTKQKTPSTSTVSAAAGVFGTCVIKLDFCTPTIVYRKQYICIAIGALHHYHPSAQCMEIVICSTYFTPSTVCIVHVYVYMNIHTHTYMNVYITSDKHHTLTFTCPFLDFNYLVFRLRYALYMQRIVGFVQV